MTRAMPYLALVLLAAICVVLVWISGVSLLQAALTIGGVVAGAVIVTLMSIALLRRAQRRGPR